jgi:alcohol-forming fatty acyl-CoA reductase
MAQALNLVEFYRGKSIFLTGTTGFVGKVVLEKLLRAIPEFKTIYVMVRPKKSSTIQERLEREILSSEIFSTIAKENPNLQQ